MSPVPDPLDWAVCALSLSWQDLDPYAFPPVAIMVEKLQDYSCRKIILIAKEWPNMPRFWDLVTMSSQIQLCLPYVPNLLTQPFIQTPHRDLSNVNLHAWFLEPPQIKEQGFSEAVAARIETPQRGSTRSVYEAKWTVNSWLPSVPIPGQEVTAKYHWWLWLKHCWQTGEFIH